MQPSDCVLYSSNVLNFKVERAWDEMIDAKIAMEKAKKRIWHHR